jgi:hypothetical protein
MLIFYHNRNFTPLIIPLAKKRIVGILRIRETTNSQELDLRKIRNFANVRKVTNRQELISSTTLKCAHMDQLHI